MSKKKRYKRDESLYNKVQDNEFLNFFDFVRYISLLISNEQIRRVGRPRKKMRDIIVCLIIWRKFKDLSVRRARSLLKLLKKFKIIYASIPSFKTLANYQEDPRIWKILDKLIEESSKPMREIEHDFATDMTGIKTKLFSSWYSIRANKEIKKRDHLNIHITTGVKSGIVTALNVELKQGKDNMILREQADKTHKNFKIDEWSGDGMYWCKKNCKKIVELGGKPYFKVHKNWNGKQSGCPAWKEMNLEFKEHPRRYGKHYHKRSNVESTNHSKKALYSDKVYSKIDSARENEETLKWINHNLGVLNRAYYEWDIIPAFME